MSRRKAPLYLGVLEDRCLLATITVTSLADNLTVNGQVTLREAIQAANTNTSVDGSATGTQYTGTLETIDAIGFAPGLVGSIVLNLGELTITEPVNILGAGPTNSILDASGNSRILTLTSTAGNVSLVGLSLINGRAAGLDGDGGAIRSLSEGTLGLDQCVIRDNVAGGDGGGIFSNGGLFLNRSTVSGNSAASLGGGVAVFTSESTAPVSVIDSTITGNTTTGSEGVGGGIFTLGATALNLLNSTVSGNTSSVRGGGIDTSDPLSLTNSTVTLNATAGDGGGLHLGFETNETPSLTVVSSIVAGNRDTGDGSHPDLRSLGAPDLTLSNSLVGNNSGTGLTPTGSTPGSNGNLIGSGTSPIDPRLAPLTANGGPTLTHALLENSPAIDRGANPNNLPTDQRGAGFFRVQGAQADMGAFELRAPLVVTTSNDELDSVFNPADLSLREAIREANTRPGADTITFATNLSGSVIELDFQLGGHLQITESVTIRGLGAQHSIISGGSPIDGLTRLFNITETAGDVTLEGLTLREGATSPDRDPGDLTFPSSGAAIRFLPDATLTIRNSVITGNRTLGDRASGGAILVLVGALTMENCTLSGNFTDGPQARGGAIYAVGHQGSLAKPVTLTNCTVTGNFTKGDNASGGAIHTRFSPVVLINTTLSNNSTGSDPQELRGNNAPGGAVFVAGASATLTVTNSTLSGNFTRGGGSNGGAIYARDGAVTLNNSTVTANRTSGDDSVGAGIGTFSAPVTLRSTIVAGNVAQVEPHAPSHSDVFLGGVLTMTHSLLGSNTGTVITPTGLTPDAAGNLIGGDGTSSPILDPMLGPLANNGGPTQTHALGINSPARDRGSNPLALTADQRGEPRQVGSGVDMGAYEAPLPRLLSPPVQLKPTPFADILRNATLKLIPRRWWRKWMVRVTTSDGQTRELFAPFSMARFQKPRVTLVDLDLDGAFDALRFTAQRIGSGVGKKVSRTVVL